MTSDEHRRQAGAKRRSHRAEAIDRVATALGELGQLSIETVVIEAPDTRIYVQFSRVGEAFTGEAVGESNLPKLTVYHIGSTMRAKLPELGWAPPVDPAIDFGNWTRTWPSSAWDPVSVAGLVVRTFKEVYGLYPWALTVSTGRGG